MANEDMVDGAPDAKPATVETEISEPQIIGVAAQFDLDDFPSEEDDPNPAPKAERPPQRAASPIAGTASSPAGISLSPTAAGSDGSADVLGFRPRQSQPSTKHDGTASGDPNGVSLLDLLESRVGLDWREAVAVVYQLCLKLKDAHPQPAILLEPRNIQLSDDGRVVLLPGQPSGDALVIQVGRLLRTLLVGKDAPPELRLLLSQATFELPIFESLDDMARALREIGRLDQADDVRQALPRALVPVPRSTIVAAPVPAAVTRPILTKARRARRTHTDQHESNWDATAWWIGAPLAAAATAAIAFLIYTTPGQPSTPVTAATPPAPAVETKPAEPPVEIVTPAAPEPASRPSVSLPPSPPNPEPRTRVATVEPRREAPRPPSDPAPAATPKPVPQEAERRATALIVDGRPREAAAVFDSLVLNNPLYEPNRHEMTPEAYTAFQASRKALLPVAASRELERAKTALASGDSDRALTLASKVAGILDQMASDPPPTLRAQVNDLIEEAVAARLVADEIIFSRTDTGVVPPRPLSRQFPQTGPAEIPPHRIGILEMVIGKQGDVEFVKLHTPLNRYHERMIVSAAKAWRYRPATKDGVPVRYRISVRVNLPESGTDFN